MSRTNRENRNERLAKHYMSPVLTMPETVPTKEVIKRMLKENHRFLVTTFAGEQIAGVLTMTDLLREIHRSPSSERLFDSPISGLAKRGIMVIEPEDILSEALDRIALPVTQFETEPRIIHALVVERYMKAIGILTQSDVLRWWADVFIDKLGEG